MPTYFFDLHNDINALDEEGQELPDLDAAKRQGIRSAREIMGATLLEKGQVDLAHRIQVREGKKLVFNLYFDEAVAVLRGGERL